MFGREQNLKLDELSPAKISRPLLVYNEKKISRVGRGSEAKTRSDVTAEEHLFGKQVQFNYILLVCCHRKMLD